MLNTSISRFFLIASFVTTASQALAVTLTISGLEPGTYATPMATATVGSAITSVNGGLVYDEDNFDCRIMNTTSSYMDDPPAAAWYPDNDELSGYIWMDSTGLLFFSLQIDFNANSVPDGNIEGPVAAGSFTTFAPVGGSSATAQSITIGLSASDLAGEADFSTCFPNATVPSSSSLTPTAAQTATTTAVTSDVFTRTTATISGNTQMMNMALSRFIGDNRSSAGDIISPDNITGPVGLQVTRFDLNANDDGGVVLSSMSYMDVANGWRRVGFADLSFQDTAGVGSTLSVNGRMSQERYLTESTLYGYFLGAELHRSDIKGSFAGKQDSWGVLAGAYTVTEVQNGMIGSTYAALGFNRSDLSIGDGTTTVTDTYDTRSLLIGSKLSGDLDYTTYRLRPSLSANYAQTDIGTLNMTETTNGTASDLSVAIGTVRFFDVVATPEFIFIIEPIGEGFSDTEFRIAPRLTCERRDAATDTRNCGSGLALGLTSTASDGMTTLNGGISFDRIGDQDRRAIQLQAEMRF